MKVALVHDWLTGMRGGERVLERIAPCTGAPSTRWLEARSVSTTIESHPSSPRSCSACRCRARYRWFLPLSPRHRVVRPLGYDVVISTVTRRRERDHGVRHVPSELRLHTHALRLDSSTPTSRPGVPWPLSWYVRRTCERLRAGTGDERRPMLLADSAHVAERIRRHWAVRRSALSAADVERFACPAHRDAGVQGTSCWPGLRPYKRADSRSRLRPLGQRVMVTGAGRTSRGCGDRSAGTEFRGW